MKHFILLAIAAILCFIPVVDAPIVEKYTALEPYTVLESISTPFTFYTEEAEWVDDGSWDRAKNSIPFTVGEAMDVFHSVTPGKWVVRQSEVTKYRTKTKEVVKYRLVTKTRTIMQKGSIIELIIR